MGLKILHSADWHLGAAFSAFSPEQRQYLTHQQRRLPGKIADQVRQQGCSLVLLAGDLFDVPQPAREWVPLLKAALEEMAVPVFISPGNHDHCCPGSPWLEENWPENVHIFTGTMESVSVPALNCRIYGAGYRSMDCPPLLTQFHAQGQEHYQICLLHGDPVQKNSPYCPITGDQMAKSELTYLALGHIHRAGALRAGQTLCGWPGCPMGRGWDETGEKGLLLVNIEENAEITPILLDMPRFYDLEAEESELMQQLPPMGSRDFYRVTLVGEMQFPLEEIRQELTRFPNLLLRDNREEPLDLWADVGSDTLRGVYFSLLQEKNADLTAKISHALLSGKEVRLE